MPLGIETCQEATTPRRTDNRTFRDLTRTQILGPEPVTSVGNETYQYGEVFA